MKKLLILLGLIFFGFSGCNFIAQSDEGAIKTGKTKNCAVTSFDSIMTLPGPDYQYGEDEILFDLDDDRVNDVGFYYYLYHGNLGASLGFMVRTLHENALMAVDSANPVILGADETISGDMSFESGQFDLYEYKRTAYHQTESGEEEIVTSGVLKDQDHQYVAIKILMGSRWKLGWIKVGLVNDNNLLNVYSFGLSK
jgi:hypothetical protein